MRRCVALLLVMMAAVAGCRSAPPIPPPASLNWPAATTSAAQPPPEGTKNVVVIGDSYTTQGPMVFPQLAGQQLMAEGIELKGAMGSEDGSGYVTPGAQGTTFGQRIAKFVTPDASVVVFVGGRADETAPADALTKATADAYAQTRSVAPGAALLVIGPFCPEGNPSPGLLAMRDIVRAQAQAAGATFVDPVDEGWLVGDPRLVGADGKLPSQAGNMFLAQKFAPILKSVLQTPGVAAPAAPDHPAR
jgi:hypothetical protein